MTTNYEISDMIDGKVTHMLINGIKLRLFKSLPSEEIKKICDTFFNAIDFSSAIKPIKSHKDIMESAIKKSPPPNIHVLGSVIYKYHTAKLYKNPVDEIRNQFQTFEFTKNDLKPILSKFFPNTNIDRKASIYFTMLNHSGICKKVDKSHSKFNIVKNEIDLEEMKKLQENEREIKANIYK